MFAKSQGSLSREEGHPFAKEYLLEEMVSGCWVLVMRIDSMPIKIGFKFN